MELAVSASKFNRLCEHLDKFGQIANFKFTCNQVTGSVDSPEVSVTARIGVTQFRGEDREASYNVKSILTCMRYSEYVSLLYIKISTENLLSK